MEEVLHVQKQRIYSIDIFRGVIMILMALDHVRDFMSNSPINPLDLTKTSAILFFTRWITHFCAPTFVFLSGTSAYLSLSSKKKSKKEASLFLLKRGLWLIFLEFTIIGFGWQFDVYFHMLFVQVIWVIGFSMIVLSDLIYLKPVYVGLFGLILIVGHNMLDFVTSDSFGNARLFWMVLHKQSLYQVNQYESVFVVYPLIPWIGVMAVGYAFGTLFKQESQARRALFIKIGAACLLIFVVLRYFNIYGDPFPWQHQAVWWKDILAFIKCQKNPPSLLFLLMTLGISIIVLGLLENRNNKLTRIFIVYGRVPLFYYILHVYLVHGIEIAIVLLKGLPVKQYFVASITALGPNGFSLPVVYLIWLAVIVILYFPCRWYIKFKQRRTDWWLSYL
jgi:uncharacterized membrane protein